MANHRKGVYRNKILPGTARVKKKRNANNYKKANVVFNIPYMLTRKSEI